VKSLAGAVVKLGRRQQVDMIRHSYTRKNRQPVLIRRLDQCNVKEQVIRLGSKNYLPGIAALDDVLRLAEDNVTGGKGAPWMHRPEQK
jgi:hypothetical protein